MGDDGYGMTLEQFKKYDARNKPKKREPSPGEEAMAQHLSAYKIPFIREYRFYPSRMWRFDFWLTDTKYAIEIEGGVWVKGGHTRGKHFEEDCIKYNTAAAMGFYVLRFSTGMAKSGQAIAFIQRLKEFRKETI